MRSQLVALFNVLLVASTALPGCGSGPGVRPTLPHDLTADSVLVVTVARKAYNERRLALGYQAIDGIHVDRFLGRDTIFFVQFARVDTAYHGGDIVRVTSLSSIVVDTLVPNPSCDGPRLLGQSDNAVNQSVIVLAVTEYWRALGPELARCSAVTAAITVRLPEGATLVRISESVPQLIYAGAVVRVEGNRADILSIMQR